MYALLFVAERGYIGTGVLTASETVTLNWKDDTTFALDHQLFREGDPACCPRRGSGTPVTGRRGRYG